MQKSKCTAQLIYVWSGTAGELQDELTKCTICGGEGITTRDFVDHEGNHGQDEERCICTL